MLIMGEVFTVFWIATYLSVWVADIEINKFEKYSRNSIEQIPRNSLHNSSQILYTNSALMRERSSFRETFLRKTRFPQSLSIRNFRIDIISVLILPSRCDVNSKTKPTWEYPGYVKLIQKLLPYMHYIYMKYMHLVDHTSCILSQMLQFDWLHYSLSIPRFR